ncbi:hypothetical protein CF319_g2833 [Tilletia indica]|nr:hypothetical protein CF319_g2833 [Tilletia indica]
MASNAPLFTKGDFYGLAITAAFFGCLIPVSLAYALFSTQRMRRLPIFWVQALALALAFVYTILELAFFRNSFRIRDGDEYWYNEGQAGGGFRIFVPLVSDVAIVMKVAAFYPSHIGAKPKRLLIIGFPSLLLVTRFIMQALTWAAYKNPEIPYLTQALTAEITMQVVGNCFCSILLLRKTFDLARNKHLTTHRAQRRLAHLIEALLMTFLPAIVVQFTLMIAEFIDVANTNNGNFNGPEITPFQQRIYRTEIYCQQANVIVSVLFGLLATLWSSIRTRSEGLGGPSTTIPGSGSQESRKGVIQSELGPAANDGGGSGAGAVATFGGSSRPSARSGSTHHLAAGMRDEDRPLLSFLVDAHNPIDTHDVIGTSSALESTTLGGVGGASSAAGLTPRDRTMSSSSNRSWIRMQQSKSGDGLGIARLGGGGGGGGVGPGEEIDMEVASTAGGESYRDHQMKAL